MITENYVSFETAKLLKEKGFNEYCECFYDTENNDTSIVNGWMYISNSELEEREFVCYSAPTIQMAMKWLREKCIFITLSIISFNLNDLPVWNFDIWRNNNHEYRSSDYFDSYEQTCETAIRYCLENLI